ncbi:HK97 family phage prohead protease [Chitinophaga pendula]|uniref:HK97 family phage prohead protease n=1 Tax=Chitinophaga TaxID=79328 RepID=UPI000BAFD714|nr:MULTISPECIES: HK97 family phage prohead protease [Chitinophaga]ASZ11089.1 hypothetical protein CK934_09005 [Chitinophaga sp. MD30]UCJ05914.1 HK97 family phage prohead protease [Chitinophaga pendula]
MAFVFNDENVVNSYGFILVNAGGDFSRFKTNPVMFYNHDIDEVIGRWGGLKYVGSQIIADEEFDEADPTGAKVKGKVDRGYLKGCSMGVIIKGGEYRQTPSGDMVLHITEWEWLETSITGNPSNSGTLRLYTLDGKQIMGQDNIQLNINSLIKNKHQIEMETTTIVLSADALVVLSLERTATGKDISAAVMELSAKLTKSETRLNQILKKRAEDLVNPAIGSGQLTADKKEALIKLAVDDYDEAVALIALYPTKKSLAATEVKNASGPSGRDDWGYMKWLKEDPKGLQEMEAKDPQQFAALKAGYKRR